MTIFSPAEIKQHAAIGAAYRSLINSGNVQSELSREGEYFAFGADSTLAHAQPSRPDRGPARYWPSECILLRMPCIKRAQHGRPEIHDADEASWP